MSYSTPVHRRFLFPSPPRHSRQLRCRCYEKNNAPLHEAGSDGPSRPGLPGRGWCRVESRRRNPGEVLRAGYSYPQDRNGLSAC
jgi:hypothetical protein